MAPRVAPPRPVTSDAWLLFATRSLRMFAYGFLSVVLVLYLKDVGMSESRIGALLTAALLGDESDVGVEGIAASQSANGCY